MTDLISIINMLTALATLAAVIIGMIKINLIEKNTNSLAERAEAAAREAGNAQGRKEQIAEQKDGGE